MKYYLLYLKNYLIAYWLTQYCKVVNYTNKIFVKLACFFVGIAEKVQTSNAKTISKAEYYCQQASIYENLSRK